MDEDSKISRDELRKAIRNERAKHLSDMRRQIDEHRRAIRELQLKRRGRQSDEARSHKQQAIIEAALRILDKEGIDGVSLRKLAKFLDIQAPALYWYFDSKTRLIDFMAEEILHKEFEGLEPRQGDEPWQDWLMLVCQRLRGAMLAHRDGARVVAGAHMYPAVTLLKLSETAMESLVSAGVELRRANLIISTAIHFVFGRVIEEQASPTPEEIKNFDFEKFFQEYPLMAKSVRQSYEEAEGGYDEFEESLRLIIGRGTEAQ